MLAEFGGLFTSAGLGLVLGSWWSGRAVRFRGLRGAAFGTILVGAAWAGYAFVGGAVSLFALRFAGSLGIACYFVHLRTAIQSDFGSARLGVVFGNLAAVQSAAILAGFALAGPILDWAGALTVYFGLGLFLVVVGGGVAAMGPGGVGKARPSMSAFPGCRGPNYAD